MIERLDGNNVNNALKDDVHGMGDFLTGQIALVLGMLEDSKNWESESEISARLALVHSAVDSFVSLWQQYATVMADKTRKFSAIDEENIGCMDATVREALIGLERRMQNNLDKSAVVNHQIAQSSKTEDAYENKMQGLITGLSVDQTQLNQQLSSLMTKVKKDLDSFTDGAIQEDSELRSEIKRTLDQFDQDLADRVRNFEIN